MKVKILGAHNSETSSSRMSGVLIDGIMALDAGSITSGLAMEEQAKLEAILLTHRHYDHLRDVPALGMNLYLNRKSATIHALPEVLDILDSSLMNNILYPRFSMPPENTPVFSFVPIEPGKEFSFNTYRILPVAMPHSVPAVGYLVKNRQNKSIFYTGDTGTGFAASIAETRPDVLITEATSPNRYGDADWALKHLTPAFLEEELTIFRKIAGYLPRVICVHMYEPLEQEIKAELTQAAERLSADITPAYEGLTFEVK
jgi:ribonuclease BN (tRNA processing enzyme)